MRLVILSDSHGYHNYVKVPDGDVMIHCGDCTNDAGQASLRDFCKWMEIHPHKTKIMIAGNHDLAFEKWPDQSTAMVRQYGINYLQDSGVVVDGVRFWGSPVQPEFCNWAFNRKRGEDIRKHWELIPNDTDVLITHGPPFSFLDRTMTGEHAGCRDLRDALYRVEPEVHCFGHIHYSYGTDSYVGDLGHKTTLINASICGEDYRPTRQPFIFDLP